MLYMRALRGYRLDREGRSSGLSKESIDAGFQVAKDNPEIVVVAQNLQNWNEGIIQLQVDAGLITKEMGDVYGKYSDYIPFYLNLEDTTTDAIEDVMLKELDGKDQVVLSDVIEEVGEETAPAVVPDKPKPGRKKAKKKQTRKSRGKGTKKSRKD